MIRNSVVVKLWLTITVLVIFVLAVLSVFLEQLFHTYLFSAQEDALRNKASYISQLLIREHNSPLAISMSQEMVKESGSQMYIIGSPFASDESSRFLDALPPEIAAKMQAGEQVVKTGTTPGFGELHSDSTNVWVLQPMREDTRLHGVLMVHQPVEAVEKAVQSIRNLIFFAAAIGVALTTGLGFVVSKNLSRPVLQMTNVAEQMARGNFRGKVNVVTGDEVGRLGITINQLAQNLAETIDNLSKEKEQLSGILLSMTDGVFSVDQDGKIVLANPPASTWLQRLQLQERGTAQSGTLPAELDALKNEVLQAPATRTAEFVWHGRNIVLTMTPLYEPENIKTVRGVVAVFRDVTQERTLEKMRKDFVASVSHELRTPLAMMQGYGEALLDEFGDDPEQRKELTQIILDETHRMKRLVNDLLDLAQLESGQFELITAEIDLKNVVQWMGRKFQTLINERNLKLAVILEQTDSFPIQGDTDRLEQVFTNLLDNAIRHTESGGVVSMSLEKQGQMAKVTITDTGEGIPEEDLPFVFERFYKVDKARTRSKGGTGLGLAITHNIVTKHRGEIIVRSRRGQGTTFIVLLPLKQNANA